MKKVLSIFLIYLLLSQISCNSDNKIKGRVLDMRNNPLKYAEVSFAAYKYDKTGISGGIKSASVTNENGEFEIAVEKMQKDEELGLLVRKAGYKQTMVRFTVEEMKKFDEVFRDYIALH